jgi:hypothetical protein
MSTQASVTCPWHGRRLEFAGNLSEIRHSSGTPSDSLGDFTATTPPKLPHAFFGQGIFAGSITRIAGLSELQDYLGNHRRDGAPSRSVTRMARGLICVIHDDGSGKSQGTNASGVLVSRVFRRNDESKLYWR